MRRGWWKNRDIEYERYDGEFGDDYGDDYEGDDACGDEYDDGDGGYYEDAYDDGYEELPLDDIFYDDRDRRHPVRRALLAIVTVILALIVLAAALPQQPVRPTEQMPPRHVGMSTILLAGTDAGGARTDTLLLLTLDPLSHRMGLTSIPRDTYVDASYSVPKINSAYGAGGGGAAGMDELMDRVAGVTGFYPDGYLLVDLDTLETLVDRMGGVWFLVPMDMQYEDPTQDLSIDLKAGYQKLDGEHALQLLRFRSGYPQADLGRVEVQRDFLQAALHQWTRPFRLLRAPLLLPLLHRHTVTDLSGRQLLWVAEGLLLCHSVSENTLPGMPKMIDGGSYFVPGSPAVVRASMLCPYD